MLMKSLSILYLKSRNVKENIYVMFFERKELVFIEEMLEHYETFFV